MSAPPVDAFDLLTEIESLGIEKVAKRYKKPQLPSKLLRDLLEEHDSPLCARFIANYPLAPSDLLDQLSSETEDELVARGLANNPRTPPTSLQRMMAHKSPRIRAAVAINPNLGTREIHKLLQDNAVEVARNLASNGGLKPQHQGVLATHADPAVKVNLLRNDSLDERILVALTTDPSPIVRCIAAAEAKPADEDQILYWATCDQEEVQQALFERRNLPESAAAMLWTSPFASVRLLAREKLALTPEALVFLADRGTVAEKVWLCEQGELPVALQSRLSQSSDAEVRAAIAKRPDLDDDIVEYLLTAGETSDALALLDNPDCDERWLNAMAHTGDPQVVAAMMYHEALTDEALHHLINVRHSPEAVAHLAMTGRAFAGLRGDIANRLARHESPTLRRFAATSEHVRPEVLAVLADDAVEAVAAAASTNPNFGATSADQGAFVESAGIAEFMVQLGRYCDMR